MIGKEKKSVTGRVTAIGLGFRLELGFWARVSVLTLEIWLVFGFGFEFRLELVLRLGLGSGRKTEAFCLRQCDGGGLHHIRCKYPYWGVVPPLGPSSITLNLIANMKAI